MIYKIGCKSCNYEDKWFCTVNEYDKKIKQKCPSCKNKTLFQKMDTFNFKLVGTGWTLSTMAKSGRPGSQEELDSELSENDYLKEQSEKHDGISNEVYNGVMNDRKNRGAPLN